MHIPHILICAWKNAHGQILFTAQLEIISGTHRKYDPYWPVGADKFFILFLMSTAWVPLTIWNDTIFWLNSNQYKCLVQECLLNPQSYPPTPIFSLHINYYKRSLTYPPVIQQGKLPIVSIAHSVSDTHDELPLPHFHLYIGFSNYYYMLLTTSTTL